MSHSGPARRPMAQRSIVAEPGSIQVTISISAPRASQGRTNSWECEFQITGIGSETIHVIRGIDEIHALLMALNTIAIHLREYAKQYELTWFGQDDLGFPIIFDGRNTRLPPATPNVP